MDCYSSDKNKFDYDLLFIGSGSAAFAGAIKASELGKKVGIIERGTVGGTCVNVGCVPSKNLIRAAETKHQIEHSRFSGVTPGKARVDFKKLIEGKDQLVGDLQNTKYLSIVEQNDDITLIEGNAAFFDQNTVAVSGKKITADKIVIVTGSSAFVPPIPGLKEAGYLTSTTAFELKELPKRLAVLGGGYIALETAQLFSRLGSQVTLIQRSDILLQEDDDVRDSIKKYLIEEGIEFLTKTEIIQVEKSGNKTKLEILSSGATKHLEVDHLLVATGRRPNTKALNLDKVGVELTESGAIKVNEYCQSTQENIYAAGDVTSSPALVYVAAYEGNLAAENAVNGNTRKVDYSIIPWVIFSDPQVVGVGLSEAQTKAKGIEYDVSTLTMNHVPRAIAAQDTRGFVKLIKKSGSDELIGARIVAPEGAELIMEIAMMLKYKIPVSEVGKMMHPYLTRSEAVKLAAQTFSKDVKSLSCCAS